GTARGRQSGRIRPPGRPAVRACARPPALLYSTPAPAARRAKRRPRPGDHTPRSPPPLPTERATMVRVFGLAALATTLIASSLAAQGGDNARPSFAEPGISPDGGEIAFVSGGDV